MNLTIKKSSRDTQDYKQSLPANLSDSPLLDDLLQYCINEFGASKFRVISINFARFKKTQSEILQSLHYILSYNPLLLNKEIDDTLTGYFRVGPFAVEFLRQGGFIGITERKKSKELKNKLADSKTFRAGHAAILISLLTLFCIVALAIWQQHETELTNKQIANLKATITKLQEENNNIKHDMDNILKSKKVSVTGNSKYNGNVKSNPNRSTAKN
ncbi:MAG: hypothetical protein ABJA79_09510 [Parafilimonas sp.]